MTNRSLRLAYCTMLPALLGACVQPPPRLVQVPSPPPPAAAPAAEVATPQPPAAPTAREAPPPMTQRVSDADRLLYYYGHIAQLSPESAAQEAERLQRYYAQRRSEFTLMQLALLKSLPTATGKDHATAVDLLAQHLKDSKERGGEARVLAQLVHAMLSEQLRLEIENQSAAQKVKEEARRNEELKQKLDALIETERKMLERSKPTRNP